MIKKIVFLFALFLSTFSSAQLAYPPQANHVKSVVLRPLAPNRYVPIMRMGEKFELSFDDLEADQKEYYYKIEHYDFDWNPSGLSDREYLIGYQTDRIRNYENSFNTLQFYTHYKVTFPNNETKFRLTGNYKITVYDEFDQIAFVRKFVLYEQKVSAGIEIRRSRDLSAYDTKQYVEFDIKYPNVIINNPSEEVKVVLMQNNDWNTAMTHLKPQYYRGQQLIYKYVNETNFWAGNEFRYFDSKGVRDANIEIARVDSGPNLYHTILFTDEERIDLPYSLNPDINGNFVIRTIDGGQNPDLDADYTWVFFSLQSLEDLRGKQIYINGAYNNWEAREEFEMKMNPDTGKYEAIVLMKQGFYNYQYITIDKDGNRSNHDIDGSFHLTENDYTVLVYYRPFGARYDQVVGIGYGKSDRILN
ncbi:DUF5103 domain-containing protein [Urechidicola vernalis]|uniref:DUF5103 domain-containing protein n=1 Tax=Urechidicola vernalis TaxID=3075600 RepID=A0ABU2Y795_9FLAO|nr:DUF5103 domain-containing protein [Urechidicola sp. P050]MDT0554075.1 DUF5103 domain-containing protein [Urechidicola sp. P050]